jgi:EpsG family
MGNVATPRNFKVAGHDLFVEYRARMALVIVSFTIVFIRMVTQPEAYADFNGYVQLLDEIALGKYSLRSYGEPLSWGVLIIFRNYLGESHSAIILGNWYLSVIYCIFIYIGIVRYKFRWQSILIIFSVYGPILAFVTIRATPAYFLVTFAAIEASRRNWRSLLIVAFAALFHSSALLAMPPILVSLCQARFFTVDMLFRSKTTAIIIAILVVLPFVMFRNNMIGLTSYALDILGDSFSRYSVYVREGQSTVESQIGGSIFQQIYFAVSSLVFLYVMVNSRNPIRGLEGYLVASYSVFVFMSVDPPSAFRQSLFWMMPLMVAFPWENVSLRGVGTCMIFPISIILFVYGFSEVLI